MKSFTRTINGIKYRGEIFEELDIINKFNLSNKEWELIDKYQKTFPELLLKGTKDFIIDGETLCSELGVKDDFNTWLLRKTKGKEGKLIKYRCIENADFICLLEKSKTQRKNGQLGAKVKNKISLTLECAKKIAMRQNNEMGDLVCNYFILMENILKDYEKWLLIREPEKEGFKEMRRSIVEWCIKNHYDPNDEYFYTRESNMLNIALTGYKACDLRTITNAKYNQTRDDLTTEVNQILSNLQFANIMMLEGNSSFSERQRMIENMCSNKYKHIKEYYVL